MSQLSVGTATLTTTATEKESIEWSSEVFNLLKDFIRNLTETSQNLPPAQIKLPTAIIEMNLFRGQHLREVIIPMLRAPPSTLSSEEQKACDVLLRAIEARLGSGGGDLRRPQNVRVGRMGGKRTRVRK